MNVFARLTNCVACVAAMAPLVLNIFTKLINVFKFAVSRVFCVGVIAVMRLGKELAKFNNVAFSCGLTFKPFTTAVN